MIKCGIRFLNIHHIKYIVPQILLSTAYQRLCIHTSWILSVKGKELLMPALSPTMENGTIVKWLKKEGDLINPGDAVADIQTDKAIMTLEFEDESIFAKIIVAEGKNVKIGELIALTVEPNEDWKSVELPVKGLASSSEDTLKKDVPSTDVPKKAALSPAITGLKETIPEGQTNVLMPSLSPTMTNGTIVKWIKKEGDVINAGDPIAEIQTDKAIMTFDMEEEVVLAKILASEGSKIEVGGLIAIIVEKGFDLSKVVIPSPLKTVPTSAATKEQSTGESTSDSVQISTSGQVYGLAVKRLLEEYGLNSDSIKGTGRPNRLLKEDVLAYIQSKHLQKITPTSDVTLSTDILKSAPQSLIVNSSTIGPSTFKEIDITNIRSVIAKRLVESKNSIPHSYASIDICIDNLLQVRKKLKNLNINVSINDFIVKAVSHVLLECPDMNSLYQNGQIIPQSQVDVSVAVSTPTGLITPIVYNTASKALDEISNDIRNLSHKAREGKLEPQEFQGGTFTISNLGMFGIKSFSAIINPPQTAILAVGAGRTITDLSLNKSTLMNVTLSYNRRAIDEEQAANFLAILQALLQDPHILAAGKLNSLRHNYEEYIKC